MIQKPPKNIPYRYNVKILDLNSFMDLFGYSNNRKYFTRDIVKIAKDSLWKKDNSNRIINENVKIAKIQKRKFKTTQNDFEKEIKRRGMKYTIKGKGYIDNFL